MVGGALAVEVTLAWNPTSATDLAGYKIYYRTCPAGSGCTDIGVVDDLSGLTVLLGDLADCDSPQYRVEGLPSDSDFVFVVTAYTNGGLESGFSNEACYLASTPDEGSDTASIDTTPPATPSALQGAPHTESGGVYLSWGASVDEGSGVDHYSIYRDGEHLQNVNDIFYLDTSVLAGSEYAYTVAAVDGAGNASTFSNIVSVTVQAQAVGSSDGIAVGDSIVIDNNDGSFTTIGNWGVSSYTAGYFGNDYRYAAPGQGERMAYWSFPVEAGQYAISARWAAYENRASNARYIIFNNGVEVGSQVCDQRVNGGQFNPFDSNFTVDTGTLDVLLTDAANGYLIADAVQIEYLGNDGSATASDNQTDIPTDNQTMEPIIVDNRDKAFLTSGYWRKSSFTPGYYAEDYHFAPAGSGGLSAAWNVSVTGGEYTVSARWCAYSNRASNASYKIYNNGVRIATKSVNQRRNGGVFYPLGSFMLNAGTLSIVLDNNASGYVIADAIKVEPSSQ
jgi:hypothetical protein